MFYKMGIGGILSVETRQAEAALKRARNEFAQLATRVSLSQPILMRFQSSMIRAARNAARAWTLLAGSVSKVGMAMRTAVLGALPLAFAIGKGVKKAVEFEKQMKAVQSILLVSDEGMRDLTETAKRMGIESVFSATQAGQAMEQMAIAGAKSHQIIGGLQGVLDMAAASELQLAQASDIVANITKGMGLSWDEASHVADVLALTATRTNTTVAQLGESFRYGMAQGRMMGFEVEKLAAIFGKLADAGNKASIGGTSLTNMLIKMTKPTAEVEERVKGWNIQFEKGAGTMESMGSIVEQFMGQVKKIKSPMERARIVTELFGIRGQKAFGALSVAGGKATDSLTEDLRNSSKMFNGMGAAAKMAQIRLDNFAGRVTLLGASLEQANIEIYGPMLKTMAKTVGGFTESLNNTLFALGILKRAQEENTGHSFAMAEAAAKYGETTALVAEGVFDAIQAMRRGWKSMVESVKSFAAWLKDSLGPEGVRRLSRYTVQFASIAAAALPIGLILAGVGWIIKGSLLPLLSATIGIFRSMFVLIFKSVIPAFIAMGRAAISAAIRTNISWSGALRKIRMGFWSLTLSVLTGFIPAIKKAWLIFKIGAGPVFLVLGLLISYIMSLKKEGESWGDVFKRTFGSVIDAAKSFWAGLKKGFSKVWTAIKTVVHWVTTAFDTLFGWLWEDGDKTTGHMKSGFAKFGEFLGTVVSVGLQMFGKLFQALNRFIEESRGYLEKAIWGFHRMYVDIKYKYAKTTAEGRKAYEKELRKLSTIHSMIEQDDVKRAARLKSQEEQLKKMTEEMRSAAEAGAEVKGAPGKPKTAPVNVNLKDERKLDVTSNLCIDGRKVASAVSRHSAEVHERAGFKKARWHKKAAMEFGVIDVSPVSTGGG